MANLPDDSKNYFTQSELPPPAPPEINIVPSPTGSQVEDGSLSSPNFKHLQSGWRISSDGTAEFSDLIIQGIPDIQTFTASGTWTKPSSGSVAFIQIWGAGGSGGSASSSDETGGGGGGGYAEKWIPLSSLSATETVTVGTGGVGVTGDVDGNPGGSSSFGSYITVYGGGGGAHHASDAGGGGGGSVLGAGGSATTATAGTAGGFDASAGGDGSGTAPLSAQSGAGGGYGKSTGPSNGGRSINGGGGGGGHGNATVGDGGVSLNGGSGSNANRTANASPGSVPGGGGGASGNAKTSGAGGDGKCIVTVF